MNKNNNVLKSSLTYEAIYPEKGTYDNILIILHGYGANAYDFLQVVPFIKKALPSTLIILPNAPFICTEDGFKWFDLETFDADYLLKQMEDNKHYLIDFISYIRSKYKLEENNFLSEKISIFGFSQGAILALHYALQANDKFNAIVAHSGPFVFNDSYKINKKQNICFVSGELDHIVEVDFIKEGYSKLLQSGILSELKLFGNLGHSLCVESIEYLLNFIKKSLT